MINDSLKEKIINNIFHSYKSLVQPNFDFLLERQNWYNNLIFKIKNIYHNITDLTDLNYDVSKSLKIIDRQNFKNLYLSLVGKYSLLIIDDTVFDNYYARSNQLTKLVLFLKQNNILLLCRDELLSKLPVSIKFDENSNLSTVLDILFSPGLKLPC
ncbi:hypothetical protein [uncultured Gilliamella sp.]|uniref:hypothetical protein n=1 Tax=uncultured Gilliamella sp. TaxID=1193505 RepID=UPI0025E42EBF|nr:hypothetical protein [uncultured Gilliamella sp.]